MQSFLKNRRGNVAVIFALSMLPIAILVGGSVDLSRMRVERTKLQSAVDAASLAATMLPAGSSDAAIRATVNSYLAANYDGHGALAGAPEISRNGTAVEVFATANVPMTFAALLGAESRPVSAHARAERGGVNLEIALVLDVTGSMAGSKIRDLRRAATDLIDIVVQDVQTPYYTRMAVVPYSVGVNLGKLADEVRGDPRLAQITDIGWSTGPAQEITDIDRSPITVTSSGHGFQNGDFIYFNGVPGMTQINDRIYTARNAATDTFQLRNSNGNTVQGSSWSNFSNAEPHGTAIECRNIECWVEINAADHGLLSTIEFDLQIAGIEATGQLRGLNGKLKEEEYEVVDADTLKVRDSRVWSGAYQRGGAFECYGYGCSNYTFRRGQNWKTWGLSNCVSERTGPEAYTDAAPEDFPVGLVYADNPNNTDCPVKEIMTLTSQRGPLRSHINGLTHGGGTAGHIGIAWGWYLLSPNFNNALGNVAAAYNAPETVKIAVIMTDGEFNTSYCNGVQQGQISCNTATMAVNAGDDPFEQAQELCDGMAEEGILVYTVSFDAGAAADAFMRRCASDDSFAYRASNGAQLNAAFRAIGDSIGQLRLTR